MRARKHWGEWTGWWKKWVTFIRRLGGTLWAIVSEQFDFEAKTFCVWHLILWWTFSIWKVCFYFYFASAHFLYSLLLKNTFHIISPYYFLFVSSLKNFSTEFLYSPKHLKFIIFYLNKSKEQHHWGFSLGTDELWPLGQIQSSNYFCMAWFNKHIFVYIYTQIYFLLINLF